MVTSTPARAHVITGGFPPGAVGGHDHDFARLRLLEFLAEDSIPASVGNDFRDIQRWLPISRLLITYVAGPFPDPDQSDAIRRWLEEGGRWLGLHGTSGGRAVRVAEGERRRRMVKAEHHEVLGGFFLSHPPIRKFTVDVGDAPGRLADGLPQSFEVIDEPYMIEVQDPESTNVWLTADIGPDTSPPGFGFAYDEDTSLMPDGRTRAMGYTRTLGKGGVTYIALGHCQTPGTGRQPVLDSSVDLDPQQLAGLRQTWESEAFQTMLRNAIAWGMAG